MKGLGRARGTSAVDCCPGAVEATLVTRLKHGRSVLRSLDDVRTDLPEQQGDRGDAAIISDGMSVISGHVGLRGVASLRSTLSLVLKQLILRSIDTKVAE